MTELEERLSRELKEISERAQQGSIRPLREPRARKRPRAVRWLAPVAAAAHLVGARQAAWDTAIHTKRLALEEAIVASLQAAEDLTRAAKVAGRSARAF